MLARPDMSERDAPKALMTRAKSSERRLKPTIEHEPIPDFDAAAEEFREANREWLVLDQKRDEHLYRNVFRASLFLKLVRQYRGAFDAECKKRRLRGKFEQRVIRFLWHTDPPKRDKAGVWAHAAMWFADHCSTEDPAEAVKLAIETGTLERIGDIATGKSEKGPPDLATIRQALDEVAENLIPVADIEGCLISPDMDIAVCVIRRQGGREFLYGPIIDSAFIRQATKRLKPTDHATAHLAPITAHPG